MERPQSLFFSIVQDTISGITTSVSTTGLTGSNFLENTSLNGFSDYPNPHVRTRSYEELITERGSELYARTDFTTPPFLEIKNKLSQLNDPPSITPDTSKLDEKYNTMLLNELLYSLKHNIKELYNQKIELHALLSSNKESFKNFSDNISKIIQTLHQEHDRVLIELLSKKIDVYYIELKLDYFNAEEQRICSELEYLKGLIENFSEMIPPSTCGICYENQVVYFLDSCGHTTCEQCKIKCEKFTYCHYCRAPKGKYRKLFYT